MEQYYKIGKLAASTGLNGEVILEHSLGKKTALPGLKALFIENKKDNFLPYFIERATARNEHTIILKLEGIETVEQARKMTPKPAWLTEGDFKKHTAAGSPLSMLGFSLIDGSNDLGEIIEVIEQPHQVLCTILYKGNEALVPVHQDNLKNIDKKHRKVFVTIPDGLLDIYG